MADYKCVYIEWIDTVSDPETAWKSVDETEEFFDRTDNVAKEVGFVFSEDEDYINIVSCYMPGNDIDLTRNRTKIPKRWITKLVELNTNPDDKV